MGRIHFKEAGMRGYEVAVMDGHKYLYIDPRIAKDSVPDGLVVYEVADANRDGTCCRVQKSVLVNFCCTLVGRHRIDAVDKEGAYYPAPGSPEYELTFVEEGVTLEEYLAMDDDAGFDTRTPVEGEYLLLPGKEYAFSYTNAHGVPAPVQDVADGLAFYGIEASAKPLCLLLRVVGDSAVRTREVRDVLNSYGYYEA